METADLVDRSKIVVLVTGASGYVALHCVKQLLEAGYSVRGTVRSKKNEQKIRPLLVLPNAALRLELVEADLLKPDGWDSIVDGCTYVLHVASPWPIVADETTVLTAVKGTQCVLQAAARTRSVKKVVLTSSCSAINDGHRNDERIFDETCWANLESPKVEYYARSKTLAERSAWEFWEKLDKDTRFQLTVLNPTFITGPVLSDVENGSCTIIGRIMHLKTFLACPKACLGLVDVRDVAKAHILAMTNSATDGERILIHAESGWFSDIAKWLFTEFRNKGYPITIFTAPNWVLKLYAKLGIDPIVEAVLPRVGPELRFDNTKSKTLLEMSYIDPHQSVISMIYSMIEHKMVKTTRKLAKIQRKQAKKQRENPDFNENFVSTQS
ncbi:unnamed protein product, partial [Mesorhabditis belari]|uniref:NAD-dependent epimerase/dehydratase domain-containing protein n=1 Tax=Mesorhabditis belari TaxID=2138241 RepID=A0AAF3FQP7_9BILA